MRQNLNLKPLLLSKIDELNINFVVKKTGVVASNLVFLFSNQADIFVLSNKKRNCKPIQIQVIGSKGLKEEGDSFLLSF